MNHEMNRIQSLIRNIGAYLKYWKYIKCFIQHYNGKRRRWEKTLLPCQQRKNKEKISRPLWKSWWKNMKKVKQEFMLKMEIIIWQNWINKE